MRSASVTAVMAMAVLGAAAAPASAGIEDWVTVEVRDADTGQLCGNVQVSGDDVSGGCEASFRSYNGMGLGTTWCDPVDFDMHVNGSGEGYADNQYASGPFCSVSAQQGPWIGGFAKDTAENRLGFAVYMSFFTGSQYIDDEVFMDFDQTSTAATATNQRTEQSWWDSKWAHGGTWEVWNGGTDELTIEEAGL